MASGHTRCFSSWFQFLHESVLQVARGSVCSVWRNLWTFFTALITNQEHVFRGCVVVPAKLEAATYPQSKGGKDGSPASKKVGNWDHWAEGSGGSGAGCFTVAAATAQGESENQHRVLLRQSRTIHIEGLERRPPTRRTEERTPGSTISSDFCSRPPGSLFSLTGAVSSQPAHRQRPGRSPVF